MSKLRVGCCRVEQNLSLSLCFELHHGSREPGLPWVQAVKQLVQVLLKAPFLNLSLLNPDFCSEG